MKSRPAKLTAAVPASRTRKRDGAPTASTITMFGSHGFSSSGLKSLRNGTRASPFNRLHSARSAAVALLQIDGSELAQDRHGTILPVRSMIGRALSWDKLDRSEGMTERWFARGSCL